MGRNPAKLEAISKECGGLPWTTKLDEVLADPQYSIYFDSQTTDRRAPDVKKAIAAGKNIYCEKPVADSLDVALELLRTRRKGRREARRRAGQALAARLAQAANPEGPRLLRPHLQRARRIRLLGLRRRHGADPAPVVELPQGGGRRHHHRHALPLALRARQSVRPGKGRLLPGRDPHSHALGRKRQALRRHRRRCRLRHVRNRRRHRRALQLVLVRARAPRRSADRPGGRHQGHRRRGPAQLLDPALRRDPAARVEPRYRKPAQLFRRLAEGPGAGHFRQRLQGPVGAVPSPRREGRALALGPHRRREGRATRREGHRKLAKAVLGRRPGV